MEVQYNLIHLAESKFGYSLSLTGSNKQRYTDPSPKTKVTNLHNSDLSSRKATDQLTQREIEILRLMADGLSNQAIAEHLVLSLYTVKWYIKQIFGKLHVG